MDLSPPEIRVLGCLLEKQRTTPDAYPLTLNALRAACNQSTNRDPVVDYDEATIRDALQRLYRRRFTRLAGAGRAAKYRHLLDEALPMTAGERAVLTVLMLRGPQTPGELKGRTDRLHGFGDLDGVHAALDELIGRGLARRLDRRPGQKEERYAHLLGDDGEAVGDAPPSVVSALAEAPVPAPIQVTPRPAAPRPEPAQPTPAEQRLHRLEEEVAALRAEVAELRALLD